ncbi:MAG: LuxR C-terminal-related transcriptional regulator [Limnohabitans sp.]|nr:LuxR C-terminal-related transcriptional regulator [Limnohabitans sp.]
MKTTAILDAPTLFRKAFSSYINKLLIKSKNHELDSVYQLENILEKSTIDYLFFDPINFNEAIFEKIIQYKDEYRIKKIIILSLQHTLLQDYYKNIDGFLTKDCSESQVSELFYCLDKEEKFFPIKKNTKVENKHNLTTQEQKILKMLMKGNSNETIADTLCISIHTFRTHRKNVMKKLGVHTTTDLVIYTLNNQII